MFHAIVPPNARQCKVFFRKQSNQHHNKGQHPKETDTQKPNKEENSAHNQTHYAPADPGADLPGLPRRKEHAQKAMHRRSTIQRFCREQIVHRLHKGTNSNPRKSMRQQTQHRPRQRPCQDAHNSFPRGQIRRFQPGAPMIKRKSFDPAAAGIYRQNMTQFMNGHGCEGGTNPWQRQNKEHQRPKKEGQIPVTRMHGPGSPDKRLLRHPTGTPRPG